MGRKLWITALTAVLLLFLGTVFVRYNPGAESAVLYLAAIVGAGAFWIGVNIRND